jgi:hypothetical protein
MVDWRALVCWRLCGRLGEDDQTTMPRETPIPDMALSSVRFPQTIGAGYDYPVGLSNLFVRRATLRVQ